ncbi:hypothetical protein FRB90_002454 [Tulasnella sp. 427]|nr:hypothetical protein FRB90_002454 [Tulasnella sp. 427]
MQASRRAELQAKKDKIEELRRIKKAREDARLAAATVQRSINASVYWNNSKVSSPTPTRNRREVDDILEEVLGRGASGQRLSDSGLGEATPPTASRPESPAVSGLPLPPLGKTAFSGSRSSDVGSDVATPFENTGSQLRFVVDFVDVEQELFELPQKQRVVYNREVQTTEIETEPTGPSEEEIRQRILQEQEAERERIRQEKEFEEQSRQLDKEIEEELRDLTEEERATIFVAPEFLDFVEVSSKIVERALSDAYDYIRDYTIGAEVGTDDSEGNRVKKICAFYDEQVNKNRSITDVDWSPKYPELSVASYNKNPAALNEPDGIVAVWNLHMLERPEFVFHSQEADDYVYDVRWHPNHPALFGAADGSGRFDLWNLNVDTEVPIVSTVIGTGRAINKFAWECKEGRRVGLGSSDGKLYIYDIGDTGNSKESDWVDLQRSLSAMAGGTGQGTGIDGDSKR